MWQLLAEGSGINLITVVGYEDEIGEGQRARLALGLRSPLDPYWAQQLQQQLDTHGVPETEVRTYGNDVDVIYRKGFPWLPVIVAVILGLIVLAVLIVSWRFYKEAPVAFSALAILALVGLGALGIYLVRRET